MFCPARFQVYYVDLVFLRDSGREALVYNLPRASARLGLNGWLDVYRVGRDGSVVRLETGVWRGELDEVALECADGVAIGE